MKYSNMFYPFDSKYELMQDEEIITQIKAGDKSALNYIMEKYKELVNMKVSKYYIIGAEKEDIIQEGMIGLYKAIKSYSDDKNASFKSFANMCIERQLITAIKTSNRQKHMPLNSYLSLNTSAYDEEDNTELMDVFNNNTVEDPLETITKKEYYETVESVIDKSLSDFEKQVLARFMKGESYIDIKNMMEGKNVIILQLESIQEFVLNKTINGKEITPNLNKFINENIRLSNMFMQSYSTTADSEFSTVTSLYPVENGMAYSRYYKNNYDDIFKIFHNKGYTTSYMHGNYGYFWNRTNVYNNMEVDHIELKDNFVDTSENIMGYLSDELLYKQAVEKLKEYGNPFISYIVAASSHTGFTLDGLEDRSKVNIDVGKYKNTFFGNYLESVNYADYAFGVFIQELKNAELYDDSLIILYGDHNGIDMYNNEMIEFLKELDNNITDTDIKLNYIRVLAGMKIPGINNLRIDKPVSKLDIKPTLAYLCNTEEGISLGTNMLAKKDFICLNNERIVTDKFYYDENWFSIETGEIEENEELKKYYDFMQKELEISKSIVLENLLK